jgi:hypothetical protein
MTSQLIPDAAGFVWVTLVAIVGIWWLQSHEKADQRVNSKTIFVVFQSGGNKGLRGRKLDTILEFRPEKRREVGRSAGRK